MATMTASDRLTALTNHSTLYELAISRDDASYHVCYAPRSRPSLWRCVTDAACVRRLVGLAGSEELTFARRAADGATLGGWRIHWTGRTEREAIAGGELPTLPLID